MLSISIDEKHHQLVIYMYQAVCEVPEADFCMIWAAYGLAMGWPSTIYGLAMGWLLDCYGLAMG